MPLVLIATGMLITLMITANAALQNALGAGPALLAVHTLGLAVIAGPAALEHRRLQTLGRVPVGLLSGGLIGLALVSLNNATMNSLGAPAVVALGLAGQGTASALIDHFGWFGRPRKPVRWRQLGPLVLAGAGVTLVLTGGR